MRTLMRHSSGKCSACPSSMQEYVPFSRLHLASGNVSISTLSIYYNQMEQNYGKMYNGQVFFVCTNVYIFNIFATTSLL